MLRVLILDRERYRSPLLTEFQEYLVNHSFKDIVFIKGDLAISLEENVKNKLNDVAPDAIYYGFYPTTYINDNIDYIVKHNIKIIAETTDNWSFGEGEQYLGMDKAKISMLIYRTKYSVGRVKKYILQEERLKECKLIYSPWSSCPEKYKNLEIKDRDIDISFIGTMYGSRPFYLINLLQNSSALKGLEGINRNLTIYSGLIYGNNYLDILSRSKITILVDVKDTILQKHIEAAMSGCLILGEIPVEGKEIFKNNISIGEISKAKLSMGMPFINDKSELFRVAKHYLENIDELKRVSEECRRRVIDSRDLQCNAKQFVEDVTKILNLSEQE